jgi:transposase
VGRKIKGIESLKGHEFNKYIKHEQSPEVRVRLLGLSHVQDGKTCRDTAKMVKMHENSVRSWVRSFASEGLEGLKNKPGRGAHKRLNRVYFSQLKEEILTLQQNRSGGRVRGKDIQQFLLREWSIDYSLSSVYDLLHELDLVWISARSKHPASSLVAQNSFKKNLSLT